MNEKIFDIYLEFNYSKLSFAVFNNLDNKIEYYKEALYENYFNDKKEINFEKIQEIIETNIFEIEKKTNKFVKDIFLIIKTPQSISIKIAVMKNNEGNIIAKEDIMYLIQDAKQQVLKTNVDKNIVHIIVENYVVDDVNYKFLPLYKNCKKISLDIKFICFPKSLINNFEKLFLKQQILINQFVCFNYINEFYSKNRDLKICELAKKIVEGDNKQEVVSIPKKIKKDGFFERLFHFFR